MKQLRVILKALLFMLAGMIGLVVLALVFHDAISRALVLQLASRIPGLDAKIEGEFDLTPAFPFTVDATGVSLEFEGKILAGSRWRFGEVHSTLRLGPLLRGVVFFEQLVVADAEISIPPLPASTENGRTTLGGVEIPFVEAVQLERVKIQFQLQAEHPVQELEIDRLQGGMDAEGRVSLEGSGTLNRDALNLEATLGSFEQFLGSGEPYPVQIALQAPDWDLEARVSGTFGEPLHLRGAELDLEASAPDLSVLRDVFAPDAPFAGAATLTAHLRGGWDAIAFSDLNASVDDGDRLRLTVSGVADGLRSAEGLDLRVEAAVRDPAVAGYLLPDAAPTVQAIVLRSRVKVDDDVVRVENLDADLRGDDDLWLKASGAIDLGRHESGWSLGSAGLDLQASARAVALERWLPESVSETGRVIAKTHVDGSTGSLSFTNFDLTLEDTEPLSGSVRGGFSYDAAQIQAMRGGEGPVAFFVPAVGEARVDVHTGDFAAAAALFGHTLADLGPVAGKAWLKVVEEGSIQMTDLDLRTDESRALSVAATGELTVASVQDSFGVGHLNLELRASGPGAEALKPLVGSLPVDPGPWSMKAGIGGQTDKLRVESFAFESGSDDSVRLEVDGSIDNLNNLLAGSGRSPTGVSFEARLNAASTERLGAAFGKTLPNLGHLSATFEGRGEQGRWTLPNAAVAIADDTGFAIEFSGAVTELLGDMKFDATFVLEAPDLQRTVARMGADIRPVSAVALGGQLKGDRELLRFVGGGDVGETALEIELESELTRPGAHLAGVITTPVMRPQDFLGPPGVNANESGETGAGPAEPGNLTQSIWLSREHLPFAYLNAVDLDLEFIADKVEGDLVNTDRLHLVVDTGQDIHRAQLNEVKFEDGSASLTIEVNTGMEPPEVAVEGRGSNIDLQALYALSSDSWGVSGARFGFDVDLTGRGRSLYELATATNGTFGNVLENARLEGLNLDLLALKTLDILTGALKSRRASTIECLVAKFKVESGVARIESLYVRTPKLRAVGDGHFDVSDESMDVVFNTEAKKGLFKSKAALRIHGPMRSPIIDKDLTGAAAGAVAGGGVAASVVVVPAIGIPVAGLSFLGGLTGGGKTRPCVEEIDSGSTE